MPATMVVVIPNADVALPFLSLVPAASAVANKGADEGRRVIFSLSDLLLDLSDCGGQSASSSFVVPLPECSFIN